MGVDSGVNAVAARRLASDDVGHGRGRAAATGLGGFAALLEAQSASLGSAADAAREREPFAGDIGAERVPPNGAHAGPVPVAFDGMAVLTTGAQGMSSSVTTASTTSLAVDEGGAGGRATLAERQRLAEQISTDCVRVPTEEPAGCESSALLPQPATLLPRTGGAQPALRAEAAVDQRTEIEAAQREQWMAHEAAQPSRDAAAWMSADAAGQLMAGGADSLGHAWPVRRPRHDRRPGEGGDTTLWSPAGAIAGGASAVATPVPPVAGDAGALTQMRVAEQVAHWVSRGVNNAELELEGLGNGPVQVKLSLKGQEARLEFRTDWEPTRQLLQDSMGQLRELLESQGLALGGVSIGASGGEGAAGRAAQESAPRRVDQPGDGRPAAGEEPTLPASFAVRGRGVVDLFV